MGTGYSYNLVRTDLITDTRALPSLCNSRGTQTSVTYRCMMPGRNVAISGKKAIAVESTSNIPQKTIDPLKICPSVTSSSGTTALTAYTSSPNGGVRTPASYEYNLRKLSTYMVLDKPSLPRNDSIRVATKYLKIFILKIVLNEE